MLGFSFTIENNELPSLDNSLNLCKIQLVNNNKEEELMYLEDYEGHLGNDVDFMDYVDHTDGDVIDLSGDDGITAKMGNPPTDVDSDESDIQPQSSNVPSSVKPAVSKPVTTTKPAGAESKMSIARRIYAEEAAKGPVVRKNVLARFISEAGCTEKGANTYYATIHSK